MREGDRIPTKKDGTYNLSKVGDAYDVIHHAVLGYKFGDTTIRRAALQGKEYIQAIGKPKAAEIDRLNNAAAFNLRKNTKENQTLEELIFKKIAERNRKLKSNTPLVKGKDFFFNTEDVQMERSGYNEGGSDDKKVSDMERLGFVKAGKLDIVKEDIEKEESRLDAELQIRQSEGSSNRGLNNRNLGNLYAGSFNKDEQKIIYNPKVIAYHGVTGIDSKGVGEKSPEVYVKFGKWVHGLRAMAHTLRKPQYRNKNLEEITNTYSRTDKDSYSNNVSSLSGNILKVGEPIDTHNDEKLRLLMKSMLINEVGHGMSPNNLLIDEAIKLSKNSMKDSEVYKTMYPKVDLTNSPPPL